MKQHYGKSYRPPQIIKSRHEEFMKQIGSTPELTVPTNGLVDFNFTGDTDKSHVMVQDLPVVPIVSPKLNKPIEINFSLDQKVNKPAEIDFSLDGSGNRDRVRMLNALNNDENAVKLLEQLNMNENVVKFMDRFNKNEDVIKFKENASKYMDICFTSPKSPPTCSRESSGETVVVTADDYTNY